MVSLQGIILNLTYCISPNLFCRNSWTLTVCFLICSESCTKMCNKNAVTLKEFLVGIVVLNCYSYRESCELLF